MASLKKKYRSEVFENRALRRIFGLRRDEMTRGWRDLHNEQLCDLYSSSSIIRMMKLRRMRWVGHVEQMGKKRNTYRFFDGEARKEETIRKTKT
jgi:hypothetical protein